MSSHNTVTFSHVAPFHLAIPVTDLVETEQFYGELLGCEKGRRSEHWIDWNFFGHQLVTHKVAEMPFHLSHNQVDSQAVPVPHFGVVLPWQAWQSLSQHLVAEKIDFVIEPYIRFAGQVGEQATLFFYDPSGNALEFKAFKQPEQLFAF